MIKPDVIVCWPRNADYPLWREFIRENRTRFNLVIIVFTETNQGLDYRAFIRDAMLRDYVLFTDSPPPRGDEDWRNVAIHHGLIHSYNAEWIWFTEQDFIVKDGFWDVLEGVSSAPSCDVACTYDNKRMHPCNIFIRRETLFNRTRRNFGIVPDISDHFSLIQQNLEGSDATIETFPPEVYEHLNGLSHNLKLIADGEVPVWSVERFNEYLRQSLEVVVPLDPRYIELVAKYLHSTAV